MVRLFKKILDGDSELDVTEKVIEIEEKYPKICSGTAVFSMVEDAKSNDEDIYKIKPIKSRKSIPRFILL